MITTTPTIPVRPARPPTPVVRPRGLSPARERARPPARLAPSRSGAGVRPALAVSLGLLWAAALFAAANAGRVPMAVLLIPVGAVAALSAARAEPAARSARLIPTPPGWPEVSWVAAVTVTPSIALPLAALAGPRVTVEVGVLLAVGAAVVISTTTAGGFPCRVLLAAFCPAIAAASMVLARGQGLGEALTLVAAFCLYDLASFIMGSGSVGGPIGVLAGWLSIGALASFVAAVVVPPYSGRNPWILLGLVAALAPVGVALCAAITRGRRVPALRRLDSLVLAGPAWVIAVSLLLHR